jgi:hypothetical protein
VVQGTCEEPLPCCAVRSGVCLAAYLTLHSSVRTRVSAGLQGCHALLPSDGSIAPGRCLRRSAGDPANGRHPPGVGRPVAPLRTPVPSRVGSRGRNEAHEEAHIRLRVQAGLLPAGVLRPFFAGRVDNSRFRFRKAVVVIGSANAGVRRPRFLMNVSIEILDRRPFVRRNGNEAISLIQNRK